MGKHGSINNKIYDMGNPQSNSTGKAIIKRHFNRNIDGKYGKLPDVPKDREVCSWESYL